MKFKKQHIIFLGIVFYTISSCTQQSIDPDVILFQKELGEENVAAIDDLVAEFEAHLNKHYPDLKTSEAYTQFLKDVSDKDTSNDALLIAYQSEENRKKFRKSSLYKDLYIREPYHQETEGLIQLNPLPPSEHDTINEPDSIFRVNPIGKYMHALYAIKDKDSVVETYFKVREGVGIIMTSQFAKGILYHKPDFDNYIHKRIVVLENSF